MSDVFISHVEEDADLALEITLGLEEAGYGTWCYELDSVPGPSYLIQTGRAIEQCKAVVLLITAHSLGSHQVTREVVRAHEGGKPFVPVLRDMTHVEFQNRQPEWREAIGSATSIRIPSQGVASILTRIIDGLRALDIHPASKPDAARIHQVRRALGELPSRGMPAEGVITQTPAREIPPTAPNGRAMRQRQIGPAQIVLGSIAAIALLVAGVLLLSGRLSKQEESPVAVSPTAAPTPPYQREEAVVEVVGSSFLAPGTRTNGIAWDGTHLWLTDNSSEIFKVDISGKTVAAFSSPAPTPEGLVWDGKTFWVFTTNYGDIYQFAVDESGGVPRTRTVSSFRSPNRTIGGTNDGLAWDGAFLWYSDSYMVYKLDTKGQVLSSFAFPHQVAGLAWDRGQLWLAYNGAGMEGATIARTDTQGNVLLSFQLTGNRIDALTWGDGHLWAAIRDQTPGIDPLRREKSMIYSIEYSTKAIRMQ